MYQFPSLSHNKPQYFNLVLFIWHWCIHLHQFFNSHHSNVFINQLLLVSKTTLHSWAFVSFQKSQIDWHKLWSGSLHKKFKHLNITLNWSAGLLYNNVSSVSELFHPPVSCWMRSSSMTSRTVNSSGQALRFSFLCPVSSRLLLLRVVFVEPYLAWHLLISFQKGCRLIPWESAVGKQRDSSMTLLFCFAYVCVCVCR